MGKTKLLGLVLLIIFMSSCTLPNKNITPSSPIKKIDQSTVDLFKDLSDKNIKWLSREGWFHYTGIPSSSGIDGLTRQDQWFLVDDSGNVQEELYVVTNADQSIEYQRFVKNKEGWRAELIELRNKGKDAFDYALPHQIKNYTVANMSRVTVDTKDIEDNAAYITNLTVSSKISEGHQLITIHVEYTGDTSVKRLGIPDGDKGKIEEFVYDQQTGQRLTYQRSYLDKDGKVGDMVSLSESIEFVKSPADNIIQDYQQSEKELEFYVGVLGK
jgi:hypothetical protein